MKLARINQLKAEQEKADLGYNWCLEQIKHHKFEDVDAKILYGVINDWYAQFLLDIGQIEKSTKFLNEAYRICKETREDNCETSVLLLNDLGITSFRAEDVENAVKYLKEAINIGTNLEDKSHLGVVHANLGLILLHKGIIKEAEKSCKEALQLGKTNNKSYVKLRLF